MSAIDPAIYARWRNSPLGSLTESIEQRTVLRLCGNLSGRGVLDLGCGDGAYALLAAQNGASAMGVDIDPAMLQAAATRAAAARLPVTWCQASIDALPFAPNTFDIATAVTVLCLCGDPDSAI